MNLKSLNIRHCKCITDSDMESLSGIVRTIFLKFPLFHLDHAEVLRSWEYFRVEQFEGLTSLKELHTCFVSITDAGVSYLKGQFMPFIITKCERLCRSTSFLGQYAKWTYSSPKHYKRLKFPFLIYLEVSHCVIFVSNSCEFCQVVF